MFKKLMLVIGTLAFISAAFAIYQWREEPLPRRRPPVSRQTAEVEAPPPSTQPVTRIEDRKAGLDLASLLKVPPGAAPEFHVFHPKTGELKYVVQAREWVRVSDNELALTEPNARVLLPGGQIAYVRADQGQLVFQVADRRMNPKRGQFEGHVHIVLDRTTREWRKANPESIEPSKHPQSVVEFFLDDVRFDLDLGQLFSDGPIRVESVDGTIEGRGLELLWNEATRQIMKLRIAEGKQATFKSTSLAGFSGASAASAKPDRPKPAPAALAVRALATPAPAATTGEPGALPPAAERSGRGLTFLDPDETDEPPENRIDTYKIVFRDDVFGEQFEEGKTVGRLKAGLLEVLMELGRQERDAVQHSPGTRPAPGEKRDRSAPRPAGEGEPAVPASTVVLNWSGEVLILPEKGPTTRPEQAAASPGGSAERFQLVAVGAPVEVWSLEMGQAHCDRLEFHQESQEVWLTGTAEKLVRMESGPRDELFGEKVYFNRKTGQARVEGAGRLVSARRIGEATAASAPPAAGSREPLVGASSGEQNDRPTVLSWSRAARITFQPYPAQGGGGSATANRPRSSGFAQTYLDKVWSAVLPLLPQQQARPERSVTFQTGYPKHAVFDGGVTLDQPGESMSADHVEVTFLDPEPGKNFSRETALAERIVATGRVRMGGTDDEITCDSLDVEMTVDDAGRNVPRVAKARGRVVARQGRREIRAADELVATFASVPLSNQEQEQLRQRARKGGFGPGSPEWAAVEKKIREDRRSIVTAMTARGQVRVRDPGDGLDVSADVLSCDLDADQRITRASVLGDPEGPAHVQTGDFYIRGPRILMDLTAQSAEVPGAGLLRFSTMEDLDGRPVDEPIPVVVTWDGHMALDGPGNVGTFTGTVKVRSESSSLDCRDRLTLRFRDDPAAPPSPAVQAPSGWVVGPLLAAVRRDRKTDTGLARVEGQWRKQLAHLDAVGAAAIEIKSYEAPSPATYAGRLWATIMPEWVRHDPTRPDARPPRRLVSGAYISGPRIAIDLMEKNLVVPGAGNLLVRDYRLPPKARSGGARSRGLLADASPGSLTGYSPGHTWFTWQKSMSFLNQRNVAVFDQRVEMVHRSGSRLEMTPELASVTGLDGPGLARLRGRLVRLSNDHLLVEFQRDDRTSAKGPASLSQATLLKTLKASGRVYMEEQMIEGDKNSSRSLEAAEINYSKDTGLIEALGTPRAPAQGMIVDLKTGRLDGPYRGSKVEWNLETGVVRILEADILAPGR